MDYFEPKMDIKELAGLSSLALAHVGDAVYELLVRTMLSAEGGARVGELHRRTVSFVRAPAQAEAAERILDMLTDEEAAVYKRGRNAHVNSVPHGANIGQYHSATALEALFGWLYLHGERARISELFARITEERDGT